MAEVQLATLAAEAREAIDGQDLARAADACRRALLRFPRWVEGYWLLGHILVESGYLPQARSCFEAVASAMPDDHRAYQGLADVAEQQHDLPTAVAGLVRALEVGETSPGVVEELRRLQEQAGYLVDNPVTTAGAAHARLVGGQYEEADVAAERALQQEPDRLDLLLVQAVARLFGGDRRGSQNVCQHLLDLSPDCLKALAILRYLQPGAESATVAADLDALDPEAQTLVWLRGQITSLGYEADDLPAAPKLVRWQEETAVAGQSGREGRPLDRLIPELEAVWPEWLQQAAQATPEVPAEEPAAHPPTFEEEPTPVPAAPSFLGDVESLAREFEDAMRAPPPEAPSAEAPEAGEAAAEAPSAWPPPTVPTSPAGEGKPAEAESAPVAPAPAGDEFGPWRGAAPAGEPAVPAAAGAETQDAGTPTAEQAAVPTTEGKAEAEASYPSKATEAAVAGTTAAPPPPPDQEREAATVSAAGAEAAQESPASPEEQDLTSLRQAAQAAVAAGDYWLAIDRYGAVLARLRAAPGVKA